MDDEAKSGTSRVVSETAPSAQNSQYAYSEGQGQGQGQNTGQCTINPCKCCCKGNLRQGSFAVAMIELVIGLGLAIYVIIGVTVLFEMIDKAISKRHTDEDNSGRQVPASAEENQKKVFDFLIFIAHAVMVGCGLSALLFLMAAFCLLIATCCRVKCCSICHSMVAGLVAVWFIIQIAYAVYLFFAMDELEEKCRTIVSSSSSSGSGSSGNSNSNSNIDASVCNAPSELRSGLGGFIALCLLFMIFFIYFAVVSAGLYTQYRAGNLYEGTSVCCCCGGSGNQIQPQQQYESQSQSQSQYREEPPPAYQNSKSNRNSRHTSHGHSNSNSNRSKRTSSGNK